MTLSTIAVSQESSNSLQNALPAGYIIYDLLTNNVTTLIEKVAVVKNGLDLIISSFQIVKNHSAGLSSVNYVASVAALVVARPLVHNRASNTIRCR